MGYYQGNGVVTSKRKFSSAIGSGWQVVYPDLQGQTIGPSGVLVFPGYQFVTYTRQYLETITVKRGVQQPADSDLTSSATFDAAGNTPGALSASTTDVSSRIGESNLFEIVRTEIATVS